MDPFGPQGVVFRKRGREIKAAIANRCAALRARLEKRNGALERFLDDRALVRSYLVRASSPPFDMHTGQGEFLAGKDDISSEQMDEIRQLCHRIMQIEQEIRRLELAAAHMNDEDVFELPYHDLVAYGFETGGA